MSDAAKDAFKLGFLTRCAEEGLTGETLAARVTQLEKAAAINLWPLAAYKLLTSFGNAASSAAGNAARVAAPLYFGLPVVGGFIGGGAAGYGAAKLTEPKLDDEQIKNEELAHTYRVYADRLRASRKQKQYR